MVNNPIFSREATTTYVGTQEKSDNQRRRRNNSKKYGSIAADVDHHQPEAQENAYFAATSTIWTTVRNT